MVISHQQEELTVMASRKAKLWKIRQKTKGCTYECRPESKVKAYRWVRNELANWLCGAVPTPFVEVWVDDRDGNGWRLYERVNLSELAELEKLEWENDDSKEEGSRTNEPAV
jgi:hypothetical protein